MVRKQGRRGHGVLFIFRAKDWVNTYTLQAWARESVAVPSSHGDCSQIVP